jgi:hypothetical protein
LSQPNIHKSEDEQKIEIDITDDDHEWAERIGKTAYELCNDPASNRIKLNEQHSGFIIDSNDAAVLGDGLIIYFNTHHVKKRTRQSHRSMLHISISD